jgi:cell wall-associated NlpC family hydrolase
MSDPRDTPANARVAADRLRGVVDTPSYSAGEVMRVTTPIAELLRAPGGARDRQLCMGEAMRIYEIHDGWAYGEAMRDGYTGYMRADALAAAPAPTHRVAARATHLYPIPDFKAHEIAALSHGSLLEVLSTGLRFAETPHGFVPKAHLTPLEQPDSDPVSVAALFLGTPYLWGGNSGFGTDCSGLVQMACLACAIPCPGDADQQEAQMGHALPPNAPLRRGDLLFWEGHVAWVAAPDMLLHANAFHMATAYEPLDAALARIEAQGDGPVTSRKRLGETRDD